MSYIVAIHDITDPDRFWGSADPNAEMPPGIALHSTYVRDDGRRATCLWEAQSIDAVREVLDATVGDSSRNEYFEVAPDHRGTRGLPTQAAADG